MDTLEEIRAKLLAGSTIQQLIKAGYAKSSVYQVAKKLKAEQAAVGEAGTDQVDYLKHKKQVMSLKAEIAELQNEAEKLPQRIAALEKRLDEQFEWTRRGVKWVLYSAFYFGNTKDTKDDDEAKEKALEWAEKMLKTLNEH